MINWPKISLITPSLNQGKYIEQTIQSVLSQNYLNLEYIVIDGGSIDGTMQILKKYKSKLKYISEPDSGQSEAINKGLKMATGEIAGFINSDDRLLPGALKTVAHVFTKNSDIMWLTGKCKTVDWQGREIRPLITRYKNFWLNRYSYTFLLIMNFISQPATFWRKRLIKNSRIGLFDQSLHYSMDYDYWLKIGRLYDPVIVNKHLAEFRIHDRSKSGVGFRKQFLAEYEIGRRYSQSKLIDLAHKIHTLVASGIYQLIH